MLEEKEWLFFEATEQRIKAWTLKNQENLKAIWLGDTPPHSPLDQAAKRASIIQEMEYTQRLEAALGHPGLSPERKRRLELHQLWVVETAFRTHPEIAEVENSLRLAMSQFEPEVQGTPTDWCAIETLLRSEPDRDLREAAWKASAPLALQLESLMGELFQLREAWAQSLVGSGFAPVAFHVQQMERTFVVNGVDELERTTRGAMPAVMKRLSQAAEVPDLQPWDYFYGLSQLLSLSQAAFPEDALLDSAKLQARRFGWEPSALPFIWNPAHHPGRAQVWGGPAGVTVISRPGSGPWSFDRFFRAYGNGLHRLLVPGSHFFMETPPPVQAEATGVFFARVLMDANWLDEHTGAGAKAIDEAIELMRAYHLLRLRFHVAHNTFENVAYAHSNVEPARLFKDIWEQIFQGMCQHSVAWATMRSYLETPLSHATPILGCVMGAQLWDAMESVDAEVWRSERVGEVMLKGWIQPGAQEPWQEALHRVTQSDINLQSFCKWLQLETFAGPQLEDAESDADTQDSISDAQAAEYFKDIDLSDLEL